MIAAAPVESASSSLAARRLPPRLVVRPIFGPPHGMDVTGAVVDAIAAQLARLHGGNDVLNQLEAERVLHDALVRLRRSATE